jgi:hypothetical protein
MVQPTLVVVEVKLGQAQMQVLQGLEEVVVQES